MRLLKQANIPFETSISISKNASSLDKALKKYIDEKKEIDKKYLKSDPSSPFLNEESKKVISGFEEDYLKELTSLNEKESDIYIEKIDPRQLFALTFPPKYIDCISFMLDIR